MFHLAKFRSFIFCFLLLLSFHGHSQNREIDSLKTLLSDTKIHDTTRLGIISSMLGYTRAGDSMSVKEYETMLVPMGFFRSHQSHLINMFYFDHYVKGDNNAIVLKDKTAIPLAIRKKEEFLHPVETEFLCELLRSIKPAFAEVRLLKRC